MVNIVDLAKDVASFIGDGAELKFAPEFDLKGIRDKRIVVVPSALKFKPLSRGCTEDSLKVQVGLIKKCTEDEVEALVAETVDLGRRFLDETIAKCVCTDVSYDPLYSAEHLRERRQFTGVIELTFRAVSSK